MTTMDCVVVLLPWSLVGYGVHQHMPTQYAHSAHAVPCFPRFCGVGRCSWARAPLVFAAAVMLALLLVCGPLAQGHRR